MRKIFLLLSLFALFCGCETERSRLAKVNLAVEVQRFDRDLFAVNKENFAEKIPYLQEKYGDFFTIFCSRIIEVGSPDSSTFESQLLAFLSDTVVQQGYQKAQSVFANDEELNRIFTQAFKRFKLNFANDSVPKVYAYVAGFNQSVILADSVLAIGLDKYLGVDFAPYTQMGFYRYMLRNMYPAKLPSDAMRYYAGGLFPSPTNNLLQKMIWEGKLLYFTKQMLPTEPDSCLFGYSAVQIKSCLDNEAYMWDLLVEEQLIFSQHFRVIREMTEEAPFTAYFSQEAPGKVANWIGYRIVEQYMKHNREITLQQLMTNHDAQEILNQSKYNPR